MSEEQKLKRKSTDGAYDSDYAKRRTERPVDHTRLPTNKGKSRIRLIRQLSFHKELDKTGSTPAKDVKETSRRISDFTSGIKAKQATGIGGKRRRRRTRKKRKRKKKTRRRRKKMKRRKRRRTRK
jgi:hypothetical protein